MKTCVLTFARNEDDYINEWIDYHLDLGFTHIFILDNNDEDEKLIIKNKNVSVIPYHLNCNDIFNKTGRNHSQVQTDAYNYAIPYIYDMGYEYMAVIDVDEFIALKKYNNINEFIQSEMIDKKLTIAELYWEIYTDNDKIWEYECDFSILKTYTEISTKNKNPQMFDLFTWTKCLIKLFRTTKFNESFTFGDDGIIYSGSGNVHWPSKVSLQSFYKGHNFIDKDIAVLNHYRTQCLERYIKHKVMNQNFKHIYGDKLLEIYFTYNTVTMEKLKAFKKICKEYNIIYDVDKYDYYIKNIEK